MRVFKLLFFYFHVLWAAAMQAPESVEGGRWVCYTRNCAGEQRDERQKKKSDGGEENEKGCAERCTNADNQRLSFPSQSLSTCFVVVVVAILYAFTVCFTLLALRSVFVVCFVLMSPAAVSCLHSGKPASLMGAAHANGWGMGVRAAA